MFPVLGSAEEGLEIGEKDGKGFQILDWLEG
jgi:hypothetical protein